MSSFFRDELATPVLHFFSVDRGERGLSRKRIVPWEKHRGQPASNMEHGFWQCNGVGPSYRSEWISLSTGVNLCLLGKRIASSKFCLGRTWISITMKFINENEVVNGRAAIILFLVCVLFLREEICPFHVSRSQKKGLETDRNSWMEIEKKCSPSSFGNGKIFGARRRGDPYHLDLVLLPLFF